MKKFKIYLLLAGMPFLLTKCSSLDKEAVKRVDEVAVSFVGVDKQLDMEGFSIAGMIQKLANDEDFKLKPLCEKLHKKTFGPYTDKMPYQVLPEDQVINTKRYKTFQMFNSASKEQNFIDSNLITKKNYKYYDPRTFDDDERRRFFNAMPDKADAMLTVLISYDLEKVNSPVPGVNYGMIDANLEMVLSKSNGETIMEINKSEISDEKMKIVLGAQLEPEKVQPMCKEATDKVLATAMAFIKDEMAAS